MKTKKLDLSNFNTSNVTNMGEMFANSSIDTLNIKSFNTSKVTNMSLMFGGSNISKLDVSSFDTSSVTDMSGMFNCEKLTQIIGLNNFNTSEVTNMDSMFSRVKIDNLNVSNFDTSNVTNMNYMFGDKWNYNTKINSITGLTNFNTTKLTTMKGMFKASSVKTIDLSSFDISNVEDLRELFYNSSATIGYAKNQATADKFNDSSVTDIPSTLKFTVK